MATPGNSSEDALCALANKFEDLPAIIASRDSQREEEMSVLTMRISSLNNRLVTEPKEQHSESRRSRRSRQKARSRSFTSSSESPDP
jgi:ribosomal protein S15P/S13E